MVAPLAIDQLFDIVYSMGMPLIAFLRTGETCIDYFFSQDRDSDSDSDNDREGRALSKETR